MTSSVGPSSVRCIGAALILAAGTIACGPALAQQPGRCNPERIIAEIDSTHAVPSLRGCAPDSVRQALRSRDYGLAVENRHSSNSIQAGGIVSQHVQARTVYVAVSTGPQDEPNPAGQGGGESHGHNGGALGGVAGQVAGGLIGAILNDPPAGPQPPQYEPPPSQYQPPQYEPPPPQYEPPPAPPVVPPVVAAPPPPPPAVKPPPPHHEVQVAQAVPQPPPVKRPDLPPPGHAAAPDKPPPVARTPAPTTAPPPVEQPPSATPPAPAPEAATNPSDRVDAGKGQEPSWWETFLDRGSSSPFLAAAIAAAVAIAAAAALAKMLWPSATCSIGRGTVALRPLPLRSEWPGLHVDTIIGSAAFSIPRPLPTGD